MPEKEKVMVVTLMRSDLYDAAGYAGAYLKLPAGRDEIKDALDRARISDGQPYKIMECFNSQGEEMSIIPDDPSLAELNFLARRVSEMDGHDRITFTGCALMGKGNMGMRDLINQTYNLDDAHAVPAKNDRELGKFYVDNDFIDAVNNVPPAYQRAAAFYKLVRYSYGSGCTSYGCQPFDIRKTFHLIWQGSRRLKDVMIENKDFEALIRQYDRDNAFIYCDPPYYQTEGHYAVEFRKEDHARLRDTLSTCRGRWLVSYNDCEFIRELYADFNIEAVSRINNLAQRYDNGCEYAEVLISNYDTGERERDRPTQLGLFDSADYYGLDIGPFNTNKEEIQNETD
ncbi:D12 class N6 adenine-specific DNA methyltransferase [Kineothrix alysoides]|uniref:site-specific DNA-methyltransferase (adenine-specific) n=1 Tax=Kineothrix alysoides TaxID=1469948 RepID=A0A4R1QP94_9FIRM|nr:DNA adenine methylase [Kineothrix alysoides]TCL54115.1 D12 class N6 adenine-specific DNA methyltransferase [Kineothrix alysoides]